MTFEGHFDDLLTVVTLCALLTSNLSATAKFLVIFSLLVTCPETVRALQMKVKRP